jgi:hemerythrin-like domain-containing protein
MNMTTTHKRSTGENIHGQAAVGADPDRPRATPNGVKSETDVHDMVVVHRAFRRELRVVPELVRQVPAGATTRTAVVASHLRLCLEGLHLHHTSEDDHLWPLLAERTDDPDLVQRMMNQHATVDDALQRIEPVLARWEFEARPAVGEELASSIDQLRAALLVHLNEEERMVLPLAARHLSQEEWGALGQASLAKMTRQQLPIMFGMVLEDADPAERAEMFAVLPLPVRLLMRTWGARQYARYVRAVRGGR